MNAMNEEQIKSRIIASIYFAGSCLVVTTCYTHYLNGLYELALGSAIAIPALMFSTFYKYSNRDRPHTDYVALPLLALLAGIILAHTDQYPNQMLYWSHSLPFFSFFVLAASLAVLYNSIFMLLMGVHLLSEPNSFESSRGLISYGIVFAMAWGFAYLLRSKKNMLTSLSVTDYLTGAFTQQQLYVALEQEISRTQETHRPLSVIAIDIDQYKQINEIHGHVTGDKLLVSFTQYVRAMIRAGDEIFRFHQTSFFLVLPNCTRDGAIVIQERMRRAVAGRKWASVGDISITTAHATLNKDETAAELIGRTSQFLYKTQTTQRKILSGF